jgi:hypothetical protein
VAVIVYSLIFQLISTTFMHTLFKRISIHVKLDEENKLLDGISLFSATIPANPSP